MKKLTFSVAVVVVLLAGGASWLHWLKAQEQAERQGGSATLTAVITKIDQANNRLTVANQDDWAEVTVTPRTKVQQGDRELAFQDLTVGQMTTATYLVQEAGHPATSIKVVDGN